MGYRSERDKDGKTIPRERSDKPRRHRNDRLDLSKQTGTPVYPPPNSVYSHAQPFYLPDTQSTPKPGSVPTTAHSGPFVAPSDRPHRPRPTIQETARPSRPATSQKNRRTIKNSLAKISTPAKNTMSVGHTKSSSASMDTSCPPVPLAKTRDPFTDSHPVKSTHASVRHPFFDPHKVADSRKASSAATPRKSITHKHGFAPRNPFTDSHRFKGTQAANRKSAWAAPVQDPFTDLHSITALSAATLTPKHDTSRQMPGASPEPDTQHSSPLSAVSSTAPPHAPIPTLPQPRRPVLHTTHPFKHPPASPARSDATSSPPKNRSSRTLPAHLHPQPPASSRSSPSPAKHSRASQTEPGPWATSSLRTAPSSSPRDSSARDELEQNPWSTSPIIPTPVVRRSSLKGATPVRAQRRFGFADVDEVRTYGEDDAPRQLGM